MPDDHDERLTILERAQLLHDATLRRHSDMLDRHDEQIALLQGLMEQQLRTQAALSALAEQLAQRQDQHEDTMARLAQLLAAIKDILDRLNGH